MVFWVLSSNGFDFSLQHTYGSELQDTDHLRHTWSWMYWWLRGQGLTLFFIDGGICKRCGHSFLILILCRIPGNRIMNDIILWLSVYIQDVKNVVGLTHSWGNCSLPCVRDRNSVSNRSTTVVAIALLASTVTWTSAYVGPTHLCGVCSLMATCAYRAWSYTGNQYRTWSYTENQKLYVYIYI